MNRAIRPLLALALLAFASSGRAQALRLVAPANGATLRGGSFAELRWSATRLPAGSEEWEAFLSVDGGKYYAFRVTPHLDIDLQRFTFVVPNVDTHDARILIRTGDEVRETHFESSGSFTIVRDRNAEESVNRVLKFGRGEAAREGDPAVVSWVDGDRNGSEVAQRVAPSPQSHSLVSLSTASRDSWPALAPAAHLVTTPSINGTLSARAKRAQRVEPIAISSDLLLVCRRLNI